MILLNHMKKVTIYTTPTCGYCKLAKAMFQEKGVTYSEKDVAADSTAADEMIQKSGQMGVPVITISNEDGSDEKLIVGFDKAGILAALGLSS